MASRRALWRRVAIAVLGAAMIGRAQAADPPPLPDDELLEYLGKFEEADQDWSDFIAAAAADHEQTARTDAPPAAKVKTDK
jgi:hypothetical protein